MPTTVVKVIGTSGDYTTIQAWMDACPANLVTADQIWQGQLKNQEFTSASALLTVSAKTTDATRYVELTCQSGASFKDNANASTNALRYNASNGAGIRCTGATDTFGGQNATIIYFTGLQIKGAGTLHTDGDATYRQCVIEITANTFIGLIGLGNLVNTLAIGDFTGCTGWQIIIPNTAGPAFVAYDSAIVVPSNRTAGTQGLRTNYDSATAIQGVYVGNCTNFYDGLNAPTTGNHNGFSGAGAIGFGTNNQLSLTEANQFVNPDTSGGTHDFRVKSGAGLIDTGVVISGVSTDIIGTSRPQGSTPDIGAWEFVSAVTYVPFELTQPEMAWRLRKAEMQGY